MRRGKEKARATNAGQERGDEGLTALSPRLSIAHRRPSGKRPVTPGWASGSRIPGGDALLEASL